MKSVVHALVVWLLLGMAWCASAASEDEYLTYALQKGDSIWSISQRYLKEPRNWSRLQQLNNVTADREIPAGTRIRIPVAWLKQGTAEVVAVRGDARLERPTGTLTLERGMKVGVGDRIRTGSGATLTLRFSDASTLSIQKDSSLAVTVMRELSGAAQLATRIRLDAGRIESSVAPRKTAGSRFEIETPMTVVGVRGTEFRVAVEKVTRSEVLKGAVEVGDQPGKGVTVPEGFGTIVDASRRPLAPIALPPAPDVSAIAPLQERPVLRLAFAAVAGAQSYRAQVSRDPAFETIIAEVVIPEPPAQFGDLPDGDYQVRIRAINAAGLEGRDGQTRFRLKATPVPPLVIAPADESRFRAPAVQFSWRAAPEAASYQLQFATDAGFRRIVREASGVTGDTYRLERIPFFLYYWRVASVRADGDRGPWSETRTFRLRPPPREPDPAAIDEKEVRFAWPGEPGQTFTLQVGRDAEFRDIVLERDLDSPEAILPRPARGVYYMRYRATDPDGFVGPYAGAQRFEVP